MMKNQLGSLLTLLLGCLIKCALFLIGAGMLVVVFGQLLLFVLIASTCLPLFPLVYLQKVLRRLQTHLFNG